MTPLALIQKAWAEGALIALTPAGRLRLTGDPEAVDRWLPICRQYEHELIEALQGAERTITNDRHT